MRSQPYVDVVAFEYLFFGSVVLQDPMSFCVSFAHGASVNSLVMFFTYEKDLLSNCHRTCISVVFMFFYLFRI